MINCQPAILSRDTGQRIPCFDSCQLTNIKRVPMVMVLLSYVLKYSAWRSDCSHVTTKMFEIDGLPNFVRHGVPLQRLRCTGAPLLC